ncbi:MAG TPA: hypothetical protein VHF92_01685 [Geodermatophilus sp.]|nr:hypothetical protein [Geodermatophilus sp.]
MPSVEAATREAAIAAARERYGSSARIVGIRRIRTGGVLGFFTTERFVAEVEPVEPSASAPPPSSEPDLPDPVAELAGLLSSSPDEPASAPVQAYTRAAFPRANRPATPAPAAPVASPVTAPDASSDEDAALLPSPFTAALARMVAGDREVREAVDDALAAAPPASPSGPVPPATAPSRSVPTLAERPAVPRPRAAEPGHAQPASVPDALPTPPAPPLVPEWVPEPGLVSGPASSREEAIAEVLRTALAHDPSDDVLADILRGVLTGAPPEDVLRTAPAPVVAPAEAPPAERPAWMDTAEWEVVAEVLAPTATDAGPLHDATAVLPPLSLLPPPSGAAGGSAVPPLLSRPPVPPPRRRPPVPDRPAGRAAASRPAADAGRRLATVTRLPVAPLAETWQPGVPVVVTSVPERPGARMALVEAVAEPPVVARLRALGVPARLLGEDFATEVAARGTYEALTRALAARLPAAPELPSRPGEVLMVVGPGVETLAAARSLAASLRLESERLQWAARGDLAALAPRSSRIATVEAARERRQEAARAGRPTVVAVDAPLRGGAGGWLEQMLAAWEPAGVWAVVEATRKPEDLGPWLQGLPRVDALMVHDIDLTAGPAAVLSRTTVPVALLDGVRATPHRWASLLCERLETAGE